MREKSSRGLIYKSECYQIIGFCYKIYNSIGGGHRESTYQKALEKVMELEGIKFESQLYVPLKIEDKIVGKFFLDLLFNDQIAIELKVGDHFLKKDIDQLYSYLKSKNLKLGLLVNFTSDGVKYKRIVNLT
jgi:GxxExxY protein